ncbi:MAG: pyrroline-5-carboxylate reductase [Holosporales bacterium]
MGTSPAFLLVGCGRMGTALVRGWREAGLLDPGLVIVTPREQSCAELLNDPRITWSPTADSLDIDPRIVIFAVKPQKLASVLPHYKRFFERTACALSVAAAKSLSFYQQHLGEGVPVVRAMPNTPASIGRGIILAMANRGVTEDHIKAINQLLAAVGSVKWFHSEDLLDRAAVLTACGPAYVYRFIETLSQAAVALGLEQNEASELTKDLLLGSLAYLDHSHQTPEILRQEVTSPKGTTAAALDVLNRDGALDALWRHALEAALRRTYELQGEVP